jgi:hypothetical protein
MNTRSLPSAPVRVMAATNDVPLVRRCLRCRTPFNSAGFGERICGSCKGTKAWRNPIVLRGSGSRGRGGRASD